MAPARSVVGRAPDPLGRPYVQRFPIRLTDRPSGPGLFANPTWLVIGDLVAVRWLIGLGAEEGRGVVTSPDVTRFHQIANSERGPYRDFEVEYTPVETIAIGLVANGERRSTAVHLAVVALCAILSRSAASGTAGDGRLDSLVVAQSGAWPWAAEVESGRVERRSPLPL